jgi:quinol monooxygenase YgiN
MAESKFMVVVAAKCDASFRQEALQNMSAFASFLKAKAGALTVRYGAIGTGPNAGNLIMFQGYEDMNAIENAWDKHQDSADYNNMMASSKMSVVVRNIIRLHPLSIEDTTDVHPKYGVLIKFNSSDPMIDEVTKIGQVFKDNGALTFRYGTLSTGSDAGHRVFGVTYPSMDSIEKAYDAANADPIYQKALSTVDVDFRNIIRFYS